jgi:hypothetical protein
VNTSNVIVSVGTATAVIAAETLTTEAGRAVVVAGSVLAFTALLRWVWRAVVNQIGSQLDTKLDPKLEALGVVLDEKIDQLASQSRVRHEDAQQRILALERARLDPAVLTHILQTLDTLSKQVHAMHTPATPDRTEGMQP